MPRNARFDCAAKIEEEEDEEEEVSEEKEPATRKLCPHPPRSSRALCGSRRRSESERVSTRGSVAAPQRDSSTHHTPHKATPRPAAPHPLAALAAASPYSYYRPPRPGLSVSHHTRRPLVPGAHAWRKLSPYAAATMVVSDELPKAPSKERGKSDFFFRKSEFVTRN